MYKQQDDPDGEHEPEGDGHEPVEPSPRDDLKVRSRLPRETADGTAWRERTSGYR